MRKRCCHGTPVVGVLVVDGLHGLELGIFDDAEIVLMLFEG
jgi:hypothetical protein